MWIRLRQYYKMQEKILLGLGGVCVVGLIGWAYQAIKLITKHKELRKKQEGFKKARVQTYPIDLQKLIVKEGRQNKEVVFNVLSTRFVNPERPFFAIVEGVMKQKYLEGVDGLPCYLSPYLPTVDKTTYPIKCHIQGAVLTEGALNIEIIPQTPRDSFWYGIASYFRGYKAEETYTPVKSIVTLSPAGLSLYGVMQFDQLSKVFNFKLNIASSTLNEIEEYFYDKLLDVGGELAGTVIKLLAGTFLLGLIGYGYYQVTTNRRRAVPRAYEGLKQPHLLVSPQTPLSCKLCRKNSTNILLNCCHLVVCNQCFPSTENVCPECGVESAEFTRIYM